ncbi:hypothetical protein GQ53DRAFT_166464 [Thozetella sp. PMI_491]|nr:hypothetical protein GQ53DRAFT_166464 [Thozetella sp. PMI_491]
MMRLTPEPPRRDPVRYCRSPLTQTTSCDPHTSLRQLSPSPHPAPRPDRYREQLVGGASRYSTRATSLTSIVDMYQHDHTGSSLQRHPPRPVGSFYYDYSEDFDTHRENGRIIIDPISPIPTRAASMCRSAILGEDCDDHLDSRMHSSESTLTSLVKLQSHQYSPHCQRPSGLTDKGSSGVAGKEKRRYQYGGSGEDVGSILSEVRELGAPVATEPTSTTAKEQLPRLSSPRPSVVVPTKISVPGNVSDNVEKIILSPTPISPARNLRVRNSITRMDTHMERMEKSLPPLPGVRDALYPRDGLPGPGRRRKALRAHVLKLARAVRVFFGRRGD